MTINGDPEVRINWALNHLRTRYGITESNPAVIELRAAIDAIREACTNCESTKLTLMGGTEAPEATK